jgi:hypothetical protein
MLNTESAKKCDDIYFAVDCDGTPTRAWASVHCDDPRAFGRSSEIEEHAWRSRATPGKGTLGIAPPALKRATADCAIRAAAVSWI